MPAWLLGCCDPAVHREVGEVGGGGNSSRSSFSLCLPVEWFLGACYWVKGHASLILVDMTNPLPWGVCHAQYQQERTEAAPRPKSVVDSGVCPCETEMPL